MSLAVTVMETLSAFVIFVAGYVVLLIATICAVVLACGIYNVVRRAKRLYGAKPPIRDRNWSQDSIAPERAERFVARQRKSPVAKLARITQVD